MWFWNGWYWLFLSLFSAPFRCSFKTGLVVIKSLSNSLSIKDFLSPSLMKLSLARYEILGWMFLSVRMLNLAPTLFWLVGFLPRDLLWVWWISLCGLPDLSLWLPLEFFPLTLVNLKIMCLGFALLEEYLCGVLCIFWTWMLAWFARLGKFFR